MTVSSAIEYSTHKNGGIEVSQTNQEQKEILTPTIEEIREYLLGLTGAQYHSDSLRESMITLIGEWFDRGIDADRARLLHPSNPALATPKPIVRHQDETTYTQDEGDWQLRPSEAGGDIE